MNIDRRSTWDSRSLQTQYLPIGVAIVITVFILAATCFALQDAAGLRSNLVAGTLSVKDYAEARNDTLRTIATLIGGLGLAGSLYFTWRNFTLAKRGQETDRYAKAVELLGSTQGDDVASGMATPNLEMRLGGIFALEQIAQDAPRLHRTIIEVLTAYVRNVSAIMHSPVPIREDIKAVLLVIKRRDTRSDITPLMLQGAYLPGADLAYFLLSHANFNSANLSGADLSHTDCSHADFRDANLTRVTFHHTIITNAQLNGVILDHADLSQCTTVTVPQIQSARSIKDTKFPAAQLE